MFVTGTELEDSRILESNSDFASRLLWEPSNVSKMYMKAYRMIYLLTAAAIRLALALKTMIATYLVNQRSNPALCAVSRMIGDRKVPDGRLKPGF